MKRETDLLTLPRTMTVLREGATETAERVRAETVAFEKGKRLRLLPFTQYRQRSEDREDS